jgi:hypothetical protein
MSNITNKALSLFPKANVLISLATPRADSIHYNDSAELLNAMLKRKFRNIKNINGIKGFQCIFQSIFVDFFTVELALPFVGINVLGV